MTAVDSAPLAKPCPLLAEYELGEILDAVPLAGGMFVRPLKIVAATGCYLLRATRFRSSGAAFEFQAHAMHQAAASGIICPRVIPDRRGRLCQRRDGRLFYVCEYLEGRQPDWSTWCRRFHNEIGFAERIGEAVAVVHAVLARVAPRGRPDLGPELPPIQFGHLKEVQDDWARRMGRLEAASQFAARSSRGCLLRHRAVIDDCWKWLVRQSAVLRLAALPRQIVHGDLSPVNLIETGDQTWGLIDWDCCHLNLPLYDALGDVVIRPPEDEAGYHQLRTEPIRRYLAAYRGAGGQRIDGRAHERLPAFCLARQLEDLRQRLMVLEEISPEEDVRYSKLIELRIDLMDQIRRTPRAEWCV